MRALEVRLGQGPAVGLLEELGDFEYRFAFDRDWLEIGRATLGLFFDDRRRELRSDGHVPLWFDHLLPPAGSALRRFFAAQIGADGDDPQGFDLLAGYG